MFHIVIAIDGNPRREHDELVVGFLRVSVFEDSPHVLDRVGAVEPFLPRPSESAWLGLDRLDLVGRLFGRAAGAGTRWATFWS